MTLLNEMSPEGRQTVVSGSAQAFYVHLDDGAVIGGAPDDSAAGRAEGARAVDASMNLIADALEVIGFVVGERSPHGKTERYVGYEPVTHPARLQLPADKAVDLREALLEVVAQPQVDTGVVRSVVGVWIWCALLRRDLLSIPRAIFRMTDGARDEIVF